MSDPVRIEPERLLAQTAWVRRLALSLSRDEASAEDLTQDALAAALRRPPPETHNEGALRAWFAAVTRNLAIHRARGDSRRDQRERAAARPELERSQERLRELEELRSELVKHVLTLSESSQQVVLLHFFEELDSAEIARRLSVPDSTIRNRLRRALAELREKIERKHGSDWRNLCLFALPTSGAKVAAGSGAAVAAAGGLWWAGGAGLLLALALLFTWHPWRSEKLNSTDSALLAAIPASIDSKPDAPASSERASPASERAPEPVVANTKPFLLFGRVLDLEKKPVKSAHISLTDDRNESVSSQDSPEGWYSFTALAPALYDARIEGDGGAPLTLQLDLRSAAGDTRRDFTLGEISYVQVRFLRADGTPWPLRQLGHSFEREHEICVVATAEAPGKTLGPSTWAGEYAHYGVGNYHSQSRDGFHVDHLAAGSSGVLDIFGPRPVFASLCQAEHVLETKLVEASTQTLDFVLTDDFMHSLAASATALVIDERSGTPAGGVRVELNPSWMGGPSSKSDAQGVVEFHDLATGTLELELGGIFRSVRIDPGKAHELGSLPWLPARKLRAKILDSEGHPTAADIHCTLDDPGLGREWCAMRLFGQADASGEFSWPEGPGFATTVLATRKTPTLQAGAARLPRGEGQVAEVRLRPAHQIGLHVKSALGGRFDVRITDADGLTLAEAGPGWSIVLPEGSYDLTVTEAGSKVHQTKFVVDAKTRSVEVSF